MFISGKPFWPGVMQHCNLLDPFIKYKENDVLFHTWDKRYKNLLLCNFPLCRISLSVCPCKPFQPRLMFASKVGAYYSAFLQTLANAVNVYHRQTHYLIWFICKLRTKIALELWPLDSLKLWKKDNIGILKFLSLCHVYNFAVFCKENEVF